MSERGVYITLEWREEGPVDANTNQRFWQKERKVYAFTDYPNQLLCHNPNCQNGGFAIGPKIAALLASDIDTEQNSLICINALHADRAKRCLHTIVYSLVCVYPYRRGTIREKLFIRIKDGK